MLAQHGRRLGDSKDGGPYVWPVSLFSSLLRWLRSVRLLGEHWPDCAVVLQPMSAGHVSFVSFPLEIYLLVNMAHFPSPSLVTTSTEKDLSLPKEKIQGA